MVAKIAKKSKYLLALLFIALIIILYKLHSERVTVYGYKVQQDYNYDFSETNGQISKLEIENGKFKLPTLTNKTAFIKLRLDANFLGKFFEPSVHIIGEEYSDKQPFEIGAKGYRFLNLSTFIENGVTEISLKGNYLTISEDDAQLIVYDNPDLLNSKILVVAPHPDDAEIAAYGLYSSHPKSFVLTVTQGDAGAFNYDEIYSDEIEHYRQKSKLRFLNSLTVPMLGGIAKDSVLNLGYFDGTLEKMYDQNPENVTSVFTQETKTDLYRNLNFSSLKDSLGTDPNWNSLIEDISFVIKQTKPSIIVTPYPKIDHHQDHKLSSIAVFEAIKSLGLKKGKLLLYTNHYANDSYPLGEMGSSISLPPSFDGGISFESVYSYQLSEDEQKEKLLALDAMNDLRLGTEWLYWDKLFDESMLKLSRTILNKDKNYFKRAVRSNELFFVVSYEELYKNKAIFER